MDTENAAPAGGPGGGLKTPGRGLRLGARGGFGAPLKTPGAGLGGPKRAFGADLTNSALKPALAGAGKTPSARGKTPSAPGLRPAAGTPGPSGAAAGPAAGRAGLTGAAALASAVDRRAAALAQGGIEGWAGRTLEEQQALAEREHLRRVEAKAAALRAALTGPDEAEVEEDPELDRFLGIFGEAELPDVPVEALERLGLGPGPGAGAAALRWAAEGAAGRLEERLE